jgi:hypothetical protein
MGRVSDGRSLDDEHRSDLKGERTERKKKKRKKKKKKKREEQVQYTDRSTRWNGREKMEEEEEETHHLYKQRQQRRQLSNHRRLDHDLPLPLDMPRLLLLAVQPVLPSQTPLGRMSRQVSLLRVGGNMGGMGGMGLLDFLFLEHGWTVRHGDAEELLVGRGRRRRGWCGGGTRGGRGRRGRLLSMGVLVAAVVSLARVLVLLIFSLAALLIRNLRRIPSHRVSKTQVIHDAVHQRLLLISLSFIVRLASLPQELPPHSPLMRDLQLVVVHRDRVDLLKQLSSLRARVREEDLEVELGGVVGRKTVSDKVEEELDPVHEGGEEGGAFRVDLVDKGVEGLLVTFDEVNKGLDGKGSVLGTD